MPALGVYLCMRSLLLGRLLREIGTLRLAVLLPVLVLLVSRALLVAAAHSQAQWLVPPVLVLLLASAHRKRADARFLASSAPLFQRWLAVEYGLVVLPVAMLLACFQDWGSSGLTLALAPGVAWLPPAREGRSTRQRARSLFRSEAFEWVSGVRGGGLWAWTTLLAGALWQRQSPLGPVVALGIWLLVVMGFFGTPEPVTMLVLSGRSAATWLWRRLLLGVGNAALTAAPLLWVLASGPVGWAGALAVGVAWLGLVSLLILTKYAFYPNATHIRTTQALVVGVALLLPGNPVYPVLLLVAVSGVIWQSHRRMRAVLGDELEVRT